MSDFVATVIPHSSCTLGSSEVASVTAALADQFVGPGPRSHLLERHWAKRTGRRYAFAVSSGFHALCLAVRALDLLPGSLLALPVMTCSALAAAVRSSGHRIALTDLRTEDLTIDAASIPREAAAILAPHAYGAPVDVQAVAARGVPWIEDCATSPATQTARGPAGSSGTLAVFSFASTKYLAAGAGGLVLTDDSDLAARIGDLLDDTTVAHWDHERPPGFPGRLADLNAALALAQSDRLEEFAAARRCLAAGYGRLLADHAKLILPPPHSGHSWYRYIVRTVPPAAPLAAALRGQGIDARDSVNQWIDQHHEGRGALCAQPFAGAAPWRGHLLSLPIHPRLVAADVERVASALLDALRSI